MGKIWGSVVFPGLGHLLSRRYLQGALLALLFSLTVQMLLVSLIWPDPFPMSEPWSFLAGLVMCIWGYGVLSHWWLLRRTAGPENADQAEQVMLAGIKAMLRNDLEEAEDAFRRVLRRDDRDVEGWLYLARTCQLQGQESRARKFYRVVKRLDRTKKWAWELETLSGGEVGSGSAITP